VSNAHVGEKRTRGIGAKKIREGGLPGMPVEMGVAHTGRIPQVLWGQNCSGGTNRKPSLRAKKTGEKKIAQWGYHRRL